MIRGDERLREAAEEVLRSALPKATGVLGIKTVEVASLERLREALG